MTETTQAKHERDMASLQMVAAAGLPAAIKAVECLESAQHLVQSGIVTHVNSFYEPHLNRFRIVSHMIDGTTNETYREIHPTPIPNLP